MRFLCDNHRKRLLQNEHQAIECWHDWMQEGSTLFEKQQWPEAFKLLGYSYEAAEWLIVEKKQFGLNEELSHIDRLLIAGHHLAECCSKGGREDLELHFLLSVHNRLINLVKQRHSSYWPIAGNLTLSMQAIKRHCKNYGDFKGYTDCITETEKYINKLRRFLN